MSLPITTFSLVLLPVICVNADLFLCRIHVLLVAQNFIISRYLYNASHGNIISHSRLLIIVMRNAIPDHVRRKVPRDVLSANDLIASDKEEAVIQTRFTDWQRTLESKGREINTNKTNRYPR